MTTPDSSLTSRPPLAARRLRRWRAAVVMLSGLVLSAAVSAASDAPFTWCVEGPKARHVLVGSVHLLPERSAGLPAAIDLALAQAEVVVFETDLDAIAKSGAASALLHAARLPAGLATVVDDQTLIRVRARAKALGMPDSACLDHQPWFCALSLELHAFQKAGFSGDQGLDRRLDRAARQRDTDIAWLEPPDQHLGLFMRMPPAVAAAFLESALAADGDHEPVTAARAIVHAWQHDDQAFIGQEIQELMQRYPDLYAHLLADRNRAWLPELKRRLDDDRPHLIVVGAAHWLGPDGLLQALAADGRVAVPYRPDAPACRAPMTRAERPGPRR